MISLLFSPTKWKVKIWSLPRFLKTLLEILRKINHCGLKAPCNYYNHDQRRKGFLTPTVSWSNIFNPWMRWKEPKDKEDPKTQQYALPSRHTHTDCLPWPSRAPLASWRLVENVTVGFSKCNGHEPSPQSQRQYLFPPSHISHFPSPVSIT